MDPLSWGEIIVRVILQFDGQNDAGIRGQFQLELLAVLADFDFQFAVPHGA